MLTIYNDAFFIMIRNLVHKILVDLMFTKVIRYTGGNMILRPNGTHYIFFPFT